MRTLLPAIVVLSLASLARADAIWISTGAAAAGNANALKLDGVKITDIAQGRIQFTSAGRESVREIQQILRIQIDDEPALSAGEEAMASGKFDAATDAYGKALDTTAKPWLKPWAAARLVHAATRANRFDAAAAGYVALILIDPAQATSLKPALPSAKSTYLATAITEVNSALATPGLSDPQKQALEAFLLELQGARGDQPAAAQTAEQLLQSNAAAGADPSLARTRLQANAAALEAKDYEKVISDIPANGALFTAASDQATALYYLAEARLGLASQKNNDPAALQDAALAYMRVVAHFKDEPQAPLVARSLLKTAEICEKLGDVAAARALFQQVLDQYPTDPASVTAKAGADRLKAKP